MKVMMHIAEGYNSCPYFAKPLVVRSPFYFISLRKLLIIR